MARSTVKTYRCEVCLLAAVLAIGMTCTIAIADVSLLGLQYQEDEPFTEYLCLWHDRDYPTSCGVDLPGANLHVFLKNDGASSVTLDDVTLAGYSLDTVLKYKALGDHHCNSIWYYWDNPPDAILDAGEPAWYKMDPASIPAGGVGQVIIRLRRVPTTSPLAVNVDTSADILNTSITVDVNAPQLANISFSQDLEKVYMYWRRAGGAAPATIKMDGVDVTSDCVSVNDSNTNFAVTVYTRSTALSELSYHVFQGAYSDSATATGGIRVWKNPFIYDSWAAFDTADQDSAMAQAWISTCEDRGINTLEMNSASSGLMDYLGTGGGRAYADAHNYGFIKDDTSWGTWSNNPRLWFIDDEPDVEESNVLGNFCGTGYKMPCGSNQAGWAAMHYISVGESLRSTKNRPTTINMNGSGKPYSWYAYGQLSDSLCIDSYYQKRVMDSYLTWKELTNTQPLYEKATVIYASSMAGMRAAEPNPSRILLFSCEANPTCKDGQDPCPTPWPFADPQTKRTEVYYALAGGAKGIGYWWFKDGKPSDGLGGNNTNLVPEDAPLWKEIGLLGAEIKTLQPYLVTSHPVDLDVVGSTDVWVKGLARGTDTLMLYAVNDNHWNDQDWHGTDTLNATITVTLPDWMQSSTPTVFEFNREGLKNVATALNGDELELSIGTLSVARMFIVTTDPLLRMTIQDRYDNVTWPGICNFASDVCSGITDPPSIVQHPSNTSVIEGGSATFLVTASGGSPLSFQWQKNGSNLSNGGHYSGCNTFALTVSSANSSDEASYRCVVTNPYGSATTNEANLTLSTIDITQQPTNQSVCLGSNAQFTVAATGEGSLSYQWQKSQVNLSNGGHYSGCTTATLTVSSADSNDVADYRCAVTDNTGTAYSDEAALTIRAGASITQQPSSQLVELGETAEFSVVVTGTGTLTYQWQKNQVNLSNGGHYSGCTTATLTVSSVDGNDEADYRCVVTDDCGSTNSNEASLVIDVCGSEITVQNGDFEGGFTGSSPNQVANSWTKYMVGGVFNEAVFTSAGGNPGTAQRMDYTKTRNNRYYGMYQTIDANAGDAFTFTAQVWCLENSNNANCSLRVDWAGGTAIGGATQVCNAAQPSQAWTQLGYDGGTATGASVTLFVDVRAYGDNNKDTDTSWDNIVAYRAYVPPAPAVSSAGSTSLDVNVNPGCNLSNSTAEYAISIGGGAFTLGTHWVQADGTVSTSAVWQTDAAWATKTVTGLATGTTYTFKAKARYNSAYTQESSLGAGADGTPGGGCTPPDTPTDAQANPSTIDPGNTSQLSAVPGSGGDTVEWFTGGCGTTPVPGGASPTVSPDVTTTYYARTKHSPSCCTSESCATVTVMVNGSVVPPDFDGDGDVDQGDFGHFQACLTGSAVPITDPDCQDANLDGDTDVDQDDFSIFQQCLSGEGMPADPSCAD